MKEIQEAQWRTTTEMKGWLGDIGSVQRDLDMSKGKCKCLALKRPASRRRRSSIRDGGYDGTNCQGSIVSCLLEYIPEQGQSRSIAYRGLSYSSNSVTSWFDVVVDDARDVSELSP